MPPCRPPSLSLSTSDDDNTAGLSHDSKLPAATDEQDSDEEGTGPDSPEAVSLTHAKRTADTQQAARGQAAAAQKAPMRKAVRHALWIRVAARDKPPVTVTASVVGRGALIRRAPPNHAARASPALARFHPVAGRFRLSLAAALSSHPSSPFVRIVSTFLPSFLPSFRSSSAQMMHFRPTLSVPGPPASRQQVAGQVLRSSSSQAWVSVSPQSRLRRGCSRSLIPILTIHFLHLVLESVHVRPPSEIASRPRFATSG
ncbi:hypothetical protein DFH09DRAFT_1502262 [Mycena vulgaris]|nr:hypothetical protein DFH09DRAFT_1502262 [Mycena vulgaris]